MGVKIRYKARTGQTLIDYFEVMDKTAFRLRLLQKVVDSTDAGIVLMVDTNQRANGYLSEDALRALSRLIPAPVVIPVPSNPDKFFGISVSMQKRREIENVIVANIQKNALTEEMFAALAGFDISLGIGPLQPFDAICDMLRIGKVPIFNTAYFEKSFYDSILCSSVRSSFDIKKIVKDIADEMGL